MHHIWNDGLHLNLADFIFFSPIGLAQCRTNRGGGRCHPFRRSLSHLEEADDTGTPPTLTEVGFERMSLVLRHVRLTHSTTAAPVDIILLLATDFEKYRAVSNLPAY